MRQRAQRNSPHQTVGSSNGPARWLLAAAVVLLFLLAFEPAGDPSDPSGRLMPWLPETVERWRGSIERSAREHGVHPALVASQMLIESGGNPYALSHRGAVGLMQVMPATAADIARQRGIERYDLWNPETNIDFGTWYLARQIELFGTADLASAAYNGGPGTVLAWRDDGQALPEETLRARHYVGGMWRERHSARSPIYEDWLARYGAGLVAEARSVQAAGLELE